MKYEDLDPIKETKFLLQQAQEQMMKIDADSKNALQVNQLYNQLQQIIDEYEERINWLIEKYEL